MLTVISPAKKLDWSPVDMATTPLRFPAEAARLAAAMRGLSLQGLRDLMDLSEDLARLNRDRFRAYSPEPAPEVTRPAIRAFAGDTYTGLEAKTLSADDLRWADGHLRILSGLYGLLRPTDAIQAYRLEMGSRLKTRRGASLYDFWGDVIARALKADAAEAGTGILVNCASEEYFRAANRAALGLRVVTPAFYEEKAGKLQMVSFYAKQARGAMARFITENRLTDPDDLRAFTRGGYALDPEGSTPYRPVFIRRNLA